MSLPLFQERLGVMNGRVFKAAALDKNVEQGRFDA